MDDQLNQLAEKVSVRYPDQADAVREVVQGIVEFNLPELTSRVKRDFERALKDNTAPDLNDLLTGMNKLRQAGTMEIAKTLQIFRTIRIVFPLLSAAIFCYILYTFYKLLI